MPGFASGSIGIRRLRDLLLLAPPLLAAAAWGCVPSPEPRRQVFEVATPYRPVTLDPQAFATRDYSSFLGSVYEGLVRLDARMRLVPALAESWSNPDPLRVVFRLRPNVRFHRGRLLRAADVVYSLERARSDPGLEASYYLVGVAGVRALGERSVEVRSEWPQPALLNRLAFVPIVPEGSGARLAREADGTGPFAVASWRPAEQVRLLRNAGYWGASPALGEVSVSFGLSPEAIVSGVEAGRFDLAVVTGTPLRSPPVGPRRYRILAHEDLHVKYLAFDVSSEVTPFCDRRPNPFRDARVRRAIDLAIDRQALRQALPAATPMWQLVPPVVFGFDPAIPRPGAQLAAARRLLREAGAAAGFSVTLHARDFVAPAARWVAQQLEPLGIRVRVELLPDERYFDGIKRHRLSFWLDNWGCTTGDSGELFENAMHSPDPASGLGAFNESGFRDRELDAEIEAGRSALTSLQRRDLLQRLMRRTLGEAPWVPLYVDREYLAIAEPYEMDLRADLTLPLAGIRETAR